MKGRVRSKIAREKRKAYITQLERRIDQLENENFRLQNLLIRYNTEKYEKIDSNTQGFVEDIQDHKIKILEKYYDLKTMEWKDDPPSTLGDNYHYNYQAMENHKKFLDAVFKMIINHPYSVTRYRYWMDLNSEYSTDFEVIKKLNKLGKYQVEEFKEANNLTGIDDYVASFQPNKRQFDFLKEVVLKKEYQVKMKFEEAIRHLLKAKMILQQANIDIYSFIGFFLKSGVFSEYQLLHSRIKDGFFKKEEAFKNIWKINVESERYWVDMAEDPIYGKYAKKHLKKSERIIYFQYNNYSLPKKD